MSPAEEELETTVRRTKRVVSRWRSIETAVAPSRHPDYQAKAPALRAAALERTLWMVTQAPSS